MTGGLRFIGLAVALTGSLGGAGLAHASQCKLDGQQVRCDDGRVGVLIADAIVWPDGTRSSVSPHPSVGIGAKPSVRVGPGVMIGDGKGGSRPMDDPSAPNKRDCAHLNGIAYCH